MQIYEIHIEGKTSYFILETSRINSDNNITKRFFLFSYNEDGMYNLVRISSIGTFMEYMNNNNVSIFGPLLGPKYDMVVSLINKAVFIDHSFNRFTSYMNLMDIDKYFDDNKIARCYQLEKEDYDLLRVDKEKNKQ